MPQHWIGASEDLWAQSTVEAICGNGKAYKGGSPCPSRYNTGSDEAWLNTTGRAAEFLRVFRGIRRVSRLDCSQAYHKGAEEQANACSYIEIL
jgi:hypothetical protein